MRESIRESTQPSASGARSGQSFARRSWAQSSLSYLSVMVLGVMTCVALSLSGCGGPPKELVKPGPAIRGLNLTGGYDCTAFGFVQLKHDVQRGLVRGTYEGIRRNENGIIQGRLQGDLVWIDWTQPGDIESAILPKRGKGWLRISERGAKISGKWGYDESRDNGGSLTLERSRYYEE